MRRYRPFFGLLLMLLTISLTGAAARAAELTIDFPLGRSAYQTNERIDVAVVRSAPEGLAAGILQLTVSGQDGSVLTFRFPLKAAGTRSVEHVYLNGRLMRPGQYTLNASADGATASAAFGVYSHIRKSSFKIIDWGTTATPKQQLAFGEDGFGFNLLFGNNGGGNDESIQAGLDFMGACTMGGGHQMELRLESDWSDPYVLQGSAGQAARFAFLFRPYPNAVGVHFYDEPGLTWNEHPETKEFGPHNIKAQDRAFKAAFGEDPLQYHKVDPNNPADVARWEHWGRWKLSFMEAAWRISADAVSRVRPDFISATQSVYGWQAFTDGYYFNIVRPLPVISGHGGYSDLGLGYLMPSYVFEFGRARDLNKPNWYLPTWYVSMTNEQFRQEQYLSFMNNLQGMAKPPWQAIQEPNKFTMTEGIVESNKQMARLGTIFATMPVTRPEAAILYSISQSLYAQTKDMTDNYTGGGHTNKLSYAYVASKLIQTPVFPIVEEDVLDGTLAANHKVVFLFGIDYLEPAVVQALEAYIVGGGAVVISDESKVEVKGASKLGATPDLTRDKKIGELWQSKAGKTKEEVEQIDAEIAQLNTVGNVYRDAEPIAAAMKARLNWLGIHPVLGSDNNQIIASRQGRGDIEYLFAVNGSYDADAGKQNSIKAATATLSMAADGRPVYNAIHGGPASEFKAARAVLTGSFRFGPGQMRVFARTARPIGGVQVATPALFRDYTDEQSPLRVEISATLVDNRQMILSGSAPLQIQLIDPLGMMRYDLYRATDKGVCTLALPLAINDPAGEWTVVVSDLLANTSGRSTFTLTAPAQGGAAAGTARRALIFGDDWQNIYRFFRTHKVMTIAIGAADYQRVQAERLAENLKLWGTRVTIINADAVKAKQLSDDEKPTWVGRFGHAGAQLKTGENHSPVFVGFDVEGPVLLFGNAQDNHLIKFLADQRFLPYRLTNSTPGPGRALLAWQVEGLRFNEESVMVIANDAEGMTEGVGALYEVAAGLAPLTPWVQPDLATVQPATQKTITTPELVVAWQLVLPDRAHSLAVVNRTMQIVSIDNSLTTVNATGRVASQRVSPDPLPAKPAFSTDVSMLPAEKVRQDRMVKMVVSGANMTAVAYWGGLLQTFDANGLKSEQQLYQDISTMAWNGDQIVVALADARLMALTVR